jgi:hypothetical protein
LTLSLNPFSTEVFEVAFPPPAALENLLEMQMQMLLVLAKV